MVGVEIVVGVSVAESVGVIAVVADDVVVLVAVAVLGCVAVTSLAVWVGCTVGVGSGLEQAARKRMKKNANSLEDFIQLTLEDICLASITQGSALSKSLTGAKFESSMQTQKVFVAYQYAFHVRCWRKTLNLACGKNL